MRDEYHNHQAEEIVKLFHGDVLFVSIQLNSKQRKSLFRPPATEIFN